MEKLDYLEIARARYTDQHAHDPTFDILVELMIYQNILSQDTVVELEEKIFDIDKSEGLLLDLIGYLVGQDRVIEGSGEFFGFKEDVTALGFGDMTNEELGGYWYSLYSTNGGIINLADDVTYRRLLKARIIYNNNLASPETLIRIVNLLTNNTTTYLTEDNGNVLINIEGDPQTLVTYYLSLRGTSRTLIPIPLGVSVGLNIIGTN